MRDTPLTSDHSDVHGGVPSGASATWSISEERAIVLDRPFLMGIVNVTPDSFSDGGAYSTPERAVSHARRLVQEGADLLDVGGESTRPGARRVDVCTQIDRVVPVIRAIREAGVGVPISVDTTRAEVARAALRVGADIINDVSAGLEDDGMLPLAAEFGCGLVLMHRERPPEEDRYSDAYETPPVTGSVTARVRDFLAGALARAVEAGVRADRVLLDPGLGFGKDVGQNLELIASTPSLLALGRPVLSALSRKSFVGRVGLGRESSPTERLNSTLGLSVVHLGFGARVFRVHDVGAHREALDASWGVHGGFSGCVCGPWGE